MKIIGFKSVLRTQFKEDYRQGLRRTLSAQLDLNSVQQHAAHIDNKELLLWALKRYMTAGVVAGFFFGLLIVMAINEKSSPFKRSFMDDFLPFIAVVAGCAIAGASYGYLHTATDEGRTEFEIIKMRAVALAERNLGSAEEGSLDVHVVKDEDWREFLKKLDHQARKN